MNENDYFSRRDVCITVSNEFYKRLQKLAGEKDKVSKYYKAPTEQQIKEYLTEKYKLKKEKNVESN